MLTSNKPDDFVMDYAEHNELAIDLEGFVISLAEIRSLTEMGWSNTCPFLKWDGHLVVITNGTKRQRR